LSVLPVGIGPVTGYNLQRSLRFRSSASAYLNRTPASTTNRRTWTWSFWYKQAKLGAYQRFFESGIVDHTNSTIGFDNSNRFFVGTMVNGSWVFYKSTAAVYRDTSAWYHFVVAVDTTQATGSNRIKIYVNGVEVTAFNTDTQNSQNFDTYINLNQQHSIGRYNANADYPDGYMAEINFIDGQALTPSSFGSTNATTGVWQPAAYTGSYGTNGFYLPFTDNSALTSGSNAGLGKDFSGNGNYWNTNNVSITSGSTYDSMTDVPTLTSATVANYCVMNPLKLPASGTVSTSNANLTVTYNNTAYASMAVTTGKWYWEAKWDSGISTSFGVSGAQQTGWLSSGSSGASYSNDGTKWINGTNTSFGASFTTSDTIGFTLDADAGTLTCYKNNTSQGAITLPSQPSGGWMPACWSGNSGITSTFNFGQRPFTYTPPSGFVALNTFNLTTPTIQNGAAYMAATTYTGTGSALTVSNAVNGVSFQPDLVWVKSRSTAENHFLFDSVRGSAPNYSRLSSNLTDAEATPGVAMLTAINSNGITLGTNGGVNTNGATFVGWQWKANGAGSSNTNGTITSTVSANTTAGFSIVTYTGNGTAGATVGHGLGVAPSFVIVKERGNANGWLCYHISTGNTGYLELDATLAFQTLSTVWNNTTPSSTVVTLGTVSNVNRNGGTFVAYCFAPVSGYSAFGSYTGNGSSDGPFVYLGFRPRYIMYKRSDSTGDWYVWDTSRDTANVAGNGLFPNYAVAEVAYGTILDILSNGFKLRTNGVVGNSSGATYIYACFAENPAKYALAR